MLDCLVFVVLLWVCIAMYLVKEQFLRLGCYCLDNKGLSLTATA